MFGLTSKQRNATKMVCYSELTSSLTSAEIKPILILVKTKNLFWQTDRQTDKQTNICVSIVPTRDWKF